jgi:ribosomal protein L4
LKLDQERAENTLKLIGISDDFLNRTPMAQQLRERIDKWDYMKLKGFCPTKEMVTRLKRLLTEREKIFASCTADKGLITRILRKLKNLNSPKINDPNKLNRVFQKEEVQMSKKHMKKLSTSLTIKEMQIKTKLKFHLTPIRMATIKNTNNKKRW